MGGGGGASSGAIDYPGYLKDVHQLLIDEVYNLWHDIWDVAPEHNPVDPSDYLGGAVAGGLEAYTQLAAFNAIDLDSRFKSLIDPTNPIGYAVDLARVNELRAQSAILWSQLMGDDAQASRDKLVAAHSTRTLDAIESTIIPKLELGMRNANMGLSTGFIVGKALIYDAHNKDIAEFSAKLEEDAQNKKWDLYGKYLANEGQLLNLTQANIQLGLQRLQLYLSQKQTTMATSISLGEAYYQHAQKYQLILVDKAIRHNTWRIETSNHVNKAIASIAGASTVKEGASINAAASTLSGAATGAAAGAMVGAQVGEKSGTGYGAAIGAIVGGLAGYLQSQ
jgi:hypothetical protein